MSLLASVSASKALKASRALAGGKSIACRYMSVIKLDGEEEVSKFRMTNSKSILYFTATWCPPCKVRYGFLVLGMFIWFLLKWSKE